MLFCRKKLEFPVIGNPENSLMDAEWFFDTNFHLNSAGKEVNTVQLIRDIKAMLGDNREVAAEIPKKPQRTWEDVSEKSRIWTKEDSQTYYGEENIVIPEDVRQIEGNAFSRLYRSENNHTFAERSFQMHRRTASFGRHRRGNPRSTGDF